MTWAGGGLTDEALALRLVEDDPVGREFARPDQERLVRAALEDGAAVGAALEAAHPGLTPPGIARALGVRVAEIHENPWSGPFLRYADYAAHPPEIRLFRSALDWLDRLLAGDDGASPFGSRGCAPIFLAHELYHHVEATRREPPLSRRHAVPRLGLGRWRLAATVNALSEVAAGSCAKTLLFLPCHPAALSLVTLEHRRSAMAEFPAQRG